jgi:alcohol dehydrogenase
LSERTAYYVKPGSIGNLSLITENIDDPIGDEVLVNVQTIGLNFADVFCCLGLYDAAPKTSFIPGLEFAGIVEKAGPNVHHFKPGDRIMGVTRFGAYATKLSISEKYLVALPQSWNFAEGSAYLVQVLTAYYGLITLGNAKTGQNILIHSAAGGVGIWANRLAKAMGCYTIGVIGHKKKQSVLENEGVDICIIRDEKSFEDDLVKALEGRDLHLIMDSIGGKIMKIGYEKLAPMGRVVAFGSAHYTGKKDRPNYLRLLWKYLQRPKIDVQNMIGENKSVMGFNLIYLFDHASLMHEILENLSAMDLGNPFIGSTYSFKALPQAIRDFQDGLTIGKVVIHTKES